MPDNLSISISADTSKARADLKLLQTEMRNVGRQINTAVKAGDTAGARTLADTFGVMQSKAAGLKKELNGTSDALNSVSRSAGFTQRSFKSLEGAILGIGRSLGGAKAGLIGFAAVTGVEKLLANLDEVDKRMRDIRDFANETSQKPVTVQARQELAGEAGSTAEKANKFMTGLNATLAKVATKTRDVNTGIAAGGDAAAEAARNFAVFGDKVVEMGRGGVPVLRDFSDALAIIQVNERQLLKLPVGQQMKVVADAFLKAQKNASQLHLTEIQLNEISKNLFGTSAADATELATAFVNLKQKNVELNNAERAATEARLKQIEELDSSRSKLMTAFWELDAKIGNASRQTRIDFADWLTDILKGRTDVQEAFTQGIAQWRSHAGDFDNWMKDTRAAFANFWPQLQTDFAASVATWEQSLPNFSGWMERTKAAFSQMWNDIKGAAASAFQALEDSAARSGAAANEVVNVFSLTSDGGGAGGTQVFRGPGTGPTGGYGPASFNQSGGYGPNSFPTQSINPGLSDYQAPPFKVVYPTRGFAWGGMVHGPGTATSDSILARLSAGEFVMRAAAVNRLGAGFLSRLNGFADGGMAMPSRGIPRFAGGGMVTAMASDGTPVHLHFPGGQFQLRGDRAVVESLTREARRAGMLSAGRIPGLA